MFASTLRKSSALLLNTSRSFTKNYEWAQRAIISTNYRTFVETRKTPLRREDFLKENEEMASELHKEKTTPAGWDKSHREEAERFSRGVGDGKRPPQDLSQDYSKPYKEFKPVGERNLEDATPQKKKEGYAQPTPKPSESDSAKDWAKIAGKDQASAEEPPKHSTKPAEEFQKSVHEVEETVQDFTSKVVHKGEELFEGAKETIKNVADKLKK